MASIMDEVRRRYVESGVINYYNLSPENQKRLKEMGYQPPPQKEIDKTPAQGMGDLRAIEKPPSGAVERSMPDTLTTSTKRPSVAEIINIAIQEAPLYKPFASALNKLGVGNVLSRIHPSLGISEGPQQPFRPQGISEWIPYIGGKIIGEAPTVAFSYLTGGAGASALARGSQLIPKATQSLSDMAARGAGAGLTHGLIRQIGDPKPLSQAIPEITGETAAFAIGDPALSYVGRQIGKQLGKFIKPPKTSKIEGLNLTKELPSPAPVKQDGLMGQGSISAAKFTIPEKMSPVGGRQKVRSLPVSIMRSDNVGSDVKASLLAETYRGGKNVYDPITNKETIAKAKELVETGQAHRYIKENPGTALSHTTALELIKKANLEGRFDDAIDLIEEVSRQATSQGQAIQSLRLWGRMTPEGMQRYYVNTVKKAGQEPKAETLKEIDTKMKRIAKMPDGREKEVETAKVLDRVASEIPPSKLQVINTLHTIAQLLNPKTAMRNIIGNLGFATLENVSDVVGAAIDLPLSRITGTRAKVMPSIMTQIRGGKQGFKLGLEDALKGIDTSHMSTKFDLPQGRTFRGGLLGKLETALNIELRATDRAFYQAAYDESLRNQMLAAGVDTPTDEMKQIAHYDGLYRTFQDDNALSNLFVTIKRALNANREFGVGDFIIKYPKTPSNLLARGIDYSPAGFVRFLLEAGRGLTGKGFNQKAFVESFSRALVGSTALFGTGALLHKLGIITSRPPEDKDLAELQRQSGFGDYRINVSALKRLLFGGGTTKPQKNDIIISYDWFEPQAIPIAIGADVDANKGTADGIVGTLINALGTGINAFAEQPVMQGIQTAFSGGYKNLSAGLIKSLEGVPASFIPTLFSQIRQLMDNQRRETYDPDKVKQAINRSISKLPVLAGRLPPKYGTLGQPLETYQDSSNTPFNVFISPAFVNRYNPSDTVKMITDIYEQTGETSHIPRVADKKIKVSGETFELTGKEYSEYQRILGEKTQKEFNKIPNNLAPEIAAKKMQKAIQRANREAKAEILKKKGINVIRKGNGLALPK